MSEEDTYRKLLEQGGKAPPAQQEKPSRRGKKALTTWLDPAVIQQIKLVCFEKNLTQQDFIKDCLNLGFAKYGKGQIA